MSKSRNKKKYRHGIEINAPEKAKVKKTDLLRRIEVIEEKLNVFLVQKTNDELAD